VQFHRKDIRMTVWTPNTRRKLLYRFTFIVHFLMALCACGGGGSSTPSYSVGGTVSGLRSGASVVLQNGGAISTTVNADGSFRFSTQMTSGRTYAVTVLAQPIGQNCKVMGGNGTVGAANVTSVQVTCVTNQYTIGGSLSGLSTASSIVLQDNGGDSTALNSNGPFTFGGSIPYSGGYAVTVATQPPAQTCTVAAGVGAAVGNVSGIAVTCRLASESVIHSFGISDGVGPQANVIQGTDGNFYGTTSGGGTSGLGTVFKVTPAGVETVLHSFAGGAADGASPLASLTQATDGNLYGTTGGGGPNGMGAVFRITPAGMETIVHFFEGAPSDGADPAAAVIQATDGNLYGTTVAGGATNNGTVFRLTIGGATTLLHSFVGGATDGIQPIASLIQANDGNFYGTTPNGGPTNGGTVFKISPGGTESVLHFFTFLNSDASIPYASLIQAGDGNFYGTSGSGGPSNSGTVFKITPAGVESVVHSFAGGATDGQGPKSALLLAADGNFYGTTSQGGPTDNGAVFKISIIGAETVIHFFTNGIDGSLPGVSLVQATDGNLYSTTYTGGQTKSGSLYRMSLSGTVTLVFSFNSNAEGRNPSAMILATDGNFYGTTFAGGTNGYGTVFKVASTGAETVLYSFAGGTADGSGPEAALVQGSDGRFYGITEGGGANSEGTVFAITPAGVETLLYSFGAASSTDASGTPAPLILAGDGNFYGTSGGGGTNGMGTVFKVTPKGVESVLYSFGGGTSDGSMPLAALIQGSDGNFYGTTYGGGPNGCGIIFKISAPGIETVLHSFALTDGCVPRARLIQAVDGSFYGTTASGGLYGNGTVFRMTPGGVLTMLYSFAGGPADGASPLAALIQGSDGNFYGTTTAGGKFEEGTIFSITPGGTATILYSFSGGADGRGPDTALIQGEDGVFYGTTTDGGASGAGTAFKF
jgi:uncharacterized repeat protein (TIGR03803 family)